MVHVIPFLPHMLNRHFVHYHLCYLLLGPHMHVQGHTCLVGQEKDRDNKWRWVLPYEDPCACTSVMTGGVNIETPERSFDPMYVEKPLRSNNIEEIREHYNLKCKGRKGLSFIINYRGGVNIIGLTIGIPQ